MKRKNLFWLCTSALLLAGCINDDDPSNVFNEQTANGNGNGNVSFVFTMNGASVDSKAPSVEDSEHEIGTTEECKLSSVRLYLYDSDSENFVESINVALNSGTTTNIDTVKYTGQATVKKAGTYNIFAIANSDQLIDEPTQDAFLARISSGSGIINSVPKNGFMMTNRGADNYKRSIQPSTDGSKPTITIPLERVVAKVELKVQPKTANKTGFELYHPTTGNRYATIDLSAYKFVNLSRHFYNFRHVASLTDGAETPSTPPAYILPTNFSNIADGSGYLIDPYFFNKTKNGAQNFNNTINGDTIYYQPFVELTTNDLVGLNGTNFNTIYCYENAMFRPAQWTAYGTGIIIKGNLTPEFICDKNGAETYYTTNVDTIYYFNYKFYDTLEAVKAQGGAKIPTDPNPSDEELKKNQIYRYTKNTGGGIDIYYNYWIKHFDNGDPTKLGVMEYSIVRNNVYRVVITDVKALGPGKPDPEIKPIEDGVLLTVECKIRPWIVRNQGAELE